MPLASSLAQRGQRALHRAYADLYQAANQAGAGREWIGEALAVWNPLDDSPAYSCLMGAEFTADPLVAWQAAQAIASRQVNGAFGLMVSPELRQKVPVPNLEELGLSFSEAESVWARPFVERESDEVATPAGGVLQVGGCDPRGFATVLNAGWELPADHGRGLLYAASTGLPGWTHYLGLVDDAPVAAAVLAIYDGLALCMVATTLPAWRGQGWQTTMLRRRLADAVAAGCTAALVETVADNASARNVERAGFELLHTREIWS